MTTDKENLERGREAPAPDARSGPERLLSPIRRPLLQGVPGCVFSDTSPRTVFGATKDGALIHVSQVSEAASDLLCPDCGGGLIARRGAQRVWHFAHAADAECRTAGETALHRLAKEIVSESMSILLPEFEVDLGDRKVIAQPALKVAFDRIDEEVTQAGFRPDLIATLGAKGQAHKLLIEVFVTHRVDSEKLARLRQHGVSAIEIDLSRVGRALTGAELRELILHDAPRRWLVHRAEAALRTKAWRMAEQAEARRARRRDFAIEMEARREAERQTARKIPPGMRSEKLETAAASARRNWTFLGMGGLFDVAADDGIFDVPRDVWRAFVLAPLSPWRKEPYAFGFPFDAMRFAEKISQDMRGRDWVKQPFIGPLKRFRDGRSQDWDPVADAIWSFLVKGLGLYGFVGLGFEKEIKIDEARRSMALGWRDGSDWAARLSALVETYAGYGIVVSLHGTPLCPSVRSEEIITIAGARGAGSRHVLYEMNHEAATGVLRYGTRHDEASYDREGISLAEPGEQDASATGRALARVRAMHRERWEQELEDFLTQQARSLLAIFEDLERRGALPRDLMEGAGLVELLSADGLRARLFCALPEEASNPLAEARKGVEHKAAQIMEIARCINAVAQIAEAVSDPDLADQLCREGVRATLARRDRLKGAFDEETCRRISEAVADLERFGASWGYGEGFALRALVSCPPGSGRTYAELMFDPLRVVAFRKAHGEIRSRPRPPTWILPEA